MNEDEPIEQRFTENVGNLTVNQDKMMDIINDNDYWAMILFLLYLDDAQKKDEQWEQFEHELIYKNRFSPDNPIVKELHKQKDIATRTIPANSIFIVHVYLGQ